MRRKIPQTFNIYLETVAKKIVGYGLRVLWKSGVSGGSLKGFFNESGVAVMLEAKVFDTLDTVSPRLGAIVIECIGNETETLLTTVFTLYADLTTFIFRW